MTDPIMRYVEAMLNFVAKPDKGKETKTRSAIQYEQRALDMLRMAVMAMSQSKVNAASSFGTMHYRPKRSKLKKRLKNVRVHGRQIGWGGR